MVIYLGSLVQLCCGEGGTLKETSLACVRSAQSGWTTVCLPLLHGVCAFPVYIAQAPGCSARDLSKEGPGLHSLPRSTPLRFRFSGTPQRHRLSWAWVLCASQVRAARPSKWLESALFTAGQCILSPPLPQPLSFLGAQRARHVRCAVCPFWGPDLWLRLS